MKIYSCIYKYGVLLTYLVCACFSVVFSADKYDTSIVKIIMPSDVNFSDSNAFPVSASITYGALDDSAASVYGVNIAIVSLDNPYTTRHNASYIMSLKHRLSNNNSYSNSFSNNWNNPYANRSYNNNNRSRGMYGRAMGRANNYDSFTSLHFSYENISKVSTIEALALIKFFKRSLAITRYWDPSSSIIRRNNLFTNIYFLEKKVSSTVHSSLILKKRLERKVFQDILFNTKASSKHNFKDLASMGSIIVYSGQYITPLIDNVEPPKSKPVMPIQGAKKSVEKPAQEKPAAIIEKPAQEKPAAIVEKPAQKKAVDNSNTAKLLDLIKQPTEKPAAIIEKPAQEKAAAIVEKPAQEKPAAIVEKPAQEKPAAIIEKPAQEKPAAIVEKPAQKKAVDNSNTAKLLDLIKQPTEKPAAIVEKPSAIIEKPAQEKPAAIVEKPAQEKAVDNSNTAKLLDLIKQPTEKPAAIVEKPAQVSAKKEDDKPQAVIYDSIPVNSNEKTEATANTPSTPKGTIITDSNNQKFMQYDVIIISTENSDKQLIIVMSE